MKKYQRTLSEDEKRQLKRCLPWFGHRRHERLREIEQGLVDVYEFDIERTWDINGCRPPCCPHTLLFETTDGFFVYIESWQETEQHNNDGDESRLTIESAPAAKRLFKTAIEGRLRIRHSEKLREFNEFFDIAGNAEWQMYKKEELPDEIMAALEAV